MLTSSQYESLKSMAQRIQPTLEIDKEDIGAKEIIDVSIALDLYELIKISFRSNAKINAETFLNAICSLTGAEPISVADDEIVIYRRSSNSEVEHIEI